MISFLVAAIQAGTPLLFATIGEIITEKSGNLNLGVEGMMLIGAVFGFMFGNLTQEPMVGILMAALTGSLAAGLFAFITVTLRGNQVVTGLALTILGTGLSGFVGQYLMGAVLPSSFRTFFSPIALPLLSKLPLLGRVLFTQNGFVYAGYALALISYFYINHTRFGLNLRVVGENPAAADASGISVSLYKYIHILVGGALCGLGGAYLSLVYVPAWQENLTAGRGWIAIALVIFSTWNTKKALFGAYLFGGLDIVGFRIQQMGWPISQYLLDMLPYLFTLMVLILVSMKRQAKQEPESLGLAYFREDRH